MTLTTKILLILLAMTVLGAAGFIFYKEHQMAAQQDAINKSMVEFKQLQDDISRSQATFASKDDLAAFAKQNQINLDTISKDLATLNASVSGINQISVSSSGSNQNNIPSTSTTPTAQPPTTINNGVADPFGYWKNQQNLTLSEPFKQTTVPFGNVSFDATKQNPWSVSVLPRNYNITNVLGTDQGGRHYIYNKFSINTNGKDYPVDITTAKYEEEYPTPSFTFFNPKISIGTDFGVQFKSPISGEVSPGVHISLSSYGNSTATPDWTFVNAGIAYGTISHNAQFILSPVQYNIGKTISFMKNTYIGPSLNISTDGSIGVGLGLRIGF